MSRDIFVQQFPEGVDRVEDIPEGWLPQALPFSHADVLRVVRELVPDADTSDPTWIHVTLPGVDIEVNCGSEAPLDSFALHVRSPDRSTADAFIRDLLGRLGARAFDSESETGIFDGASPG